MTIKKGKARKIELAGTGETITTTATIIEKTVGGYTEVLGCRDSWEVSVDGNVLTSEYRNEFAVYHGRSISDILSSYGIFGEFAWLEPMTEVA